MSTHELARRINRTSPFGGAWFGLIASTGTNDPSDLVKVVIPDIDPKRTFGPCRWQPRGDGEFPARGDKCLVLFDNRRTPWVIMWWPFDD